MAHASRRRPDDGSAVADHVMTPAFAWRSAASSSSTAASHQGTGAPRATLSQKNETPAPPDLEAPAESRFLVHAAASKIEPLVTIVKWWFEVPYRLLSERARRLLSHLAYVGGARVAV